jgi:hypothetical protein
VRDLTKWPRLIVVPEKPEPVTREQANEILIRTTSPYLYTNDHLLDLAVREILGHPHKDSWHGPAAGEVKDWIGAEREWRASLGILDLHYVYNSRIVSAWIGGPHGWCDWDGTLGCSTWNIGKWPSREDVTADWEAIAAAFPYLDLHVQLIITDSGDGELADEWRVHDGHAAPVEPVDRFTAKDLSDADVLGRFLYGSECGVSLERLREAVGQVRKSCG